MVTRTSYEHGTPSWIDLMTPDVDGARAFYGGLFGWTADETTDDDGALLYVNLRKDGKLVAGLGEQPPEMAGMPPVWSTYVAVDNVDDVLEKVPAAGGTVMMPGMDVMEDVGRMAIFHDPTGAVIGLWQAGTHLGAERVNEPDTWFWNELLTRDVDTAKAFYSAVFDWDWNGMDMGPMGTYHVVAGGESDGLAGMMAMPAEMPEQVPNHWMIYVMVADADATAARAVELGGQVVQPPFDTPVGRQAVLHDPAGGSFSIMQPADHSEDES